MKKHVSKTEEKKIVIELEKIKKEYEIFRTIINFIGDAVISTDPIGNITGMNPFAEKLTGWKLGEVVGKPLIKVFNILNYNTREKAENMLHKVFNGDKICKLSDNNLLISKDGNEYLIEYSCSQIRDNNNKITDMVVVIRDISKLKFMEKAQQTLEQNYREIFDATNDAIIVHDMGTGKIIDVNRELCELLGYSYQEVKHLTIKDLSSGKPPYTEKIGKEWIKKAIEEGLQLFEWLARKKNGELIWLEINLKRVKIGGEDRIIAVDRDITNRKKVEEKLEKYHDSLEELVKERTIELEKKNAELERYNNLFVGREFRIKELRDKVKKLEEIINEKE